MRRSANNGEAVVLKENEDTCATLDIDLHHIIKLTFRQRMFSYLDRNLAPYTFAAVNFEVQYPRVAQQLHSGCR